MLTFKITYAFVKVLYFCITYLLFLKLWVHSSGYEYLNFRICCTLCYVYFLLVYYKRLHNFVFNSGFWGVLCVGIFSRSCLIEEVYETACYCKELVLPETVNENALNDSYTHIKNCLFIYLHSWKIKDYVLHTNLLGHCLLLSGQLDVVQLCFLF